MPEPERVEAARPNSEMIRCLNLIPTTEYERQPTSSFNPRINNGELNLFLNVDSTNMETLSANDNSVAQDIRYLKFRIS